MTEAHERPSVSAGGARAKVFKKNSRTYIHINKNEDCLLQKLMQLYQDCLERSVKHMLGTAVLLSLKPTVSNLTCADLLFASWLE